MAEQSQLTPEIFYQVFHICLSYAQSIVGKKIAQDLLRKSYDKILPYFHILKSFRWDDVDDFQVVNDNPTEKELLGFAVWMQQFIKEVQDFMIGLPEISIEELTADLKADLDACGFYEFYHQAEELEY